MQNIGSMAYTPCIKGVYKGKCSCGEELIHDFDKPILPNLLTGYFGEAFLSVRCNNCAAITLVDGAKVPGAQHY